MDDVRKNLEIIIKNPLMENIEFAPTLSSKLRFIEIKSNYYFLQRNKKMELEFAIQKDNFLKTNWPTFINDFPYDFIAFYSRFLYLYYSESNILFLKSVRFFLSFPYTLKSRNRFVESFVWAYYYNFKLEILIRRNRFIKASNVLSQINKKHISYFELAPSTLKTTFFYRIAYIEFINGKFNKSLSAINIVINEHDNVQIKDVFIMAKLFNIIIHYELKHFTLIEHLSKQLIRQLKNLVNSSEISITLLKAFQKLVVYNNTEENNQVFKKLILFIEENQTEYQSSKLPNYFDFYSWLKSKVNRTTMLQEILNKENLIQ